VSEVAQIDHNQRKRVVGQRGERLLAQARYPQKDKLTWLDVDRAIKYQDRYIVGDALIFHQPDGFKTHVYIVLHALFAGILLRFQIAFESLEVADHLFGRHPGQRRTNPDD
jgi:hypothetical protein